MNRPEASTTFANKAGSALSLIYIKAQNKFTWAVINREKMNSEIITSDSEESKKTKTKKVTLRAFEVKNISLTQSSSNAKSLLLKRLDELKAAKNRCMILNHDDPNQERDLISYFKETPASNSVFCTMLRISSDSDVQHITDSLFEKEFFTMDEIDCKRTY